MNKRPLDFYGPDDYTGGDWEDDDRRIKEAQERWDAEYKALSWWEKVKHHLHLWSIGE